MKKIKKIKVIPNLIMMFVMLFYLLPLWYIVNNALKKVEFISAAPFTISVQSFTFDNIKNSFVLFKYPQAILNSLSILVLASAMLILLGSLAAYGITSGGGKLMSNTYTFFAALISVPFQIAMVPLMIELKSMGLINTYLGASLVYAAMYLPFVIFLYVGFMRSISKEMREAAEIDGCGPLRTYLFIYMPLLKTITGIVLVLRGVGIWNDLLVPLIVIYKDSMYTLPLRLYVFATSLIGKWDIIFGGTILVCLPITVLFLVLQKSFIRGIMAGGVKG